MLGATRTSSTSGYIKQQDKRHKPLTSLAYQGKPLVMMSESRMAASCFPASAVGNFEDSTNARLLDKRPCRGVFSMSAAETHEQTRICSPEHLTRAVQAKDLTARSGRGSRPRFHCVSSDWPLTHVEAHGGNSSPDDGLHSVGPRAVLMAEGMAWQSHVSGVRW